MSFRFIITGLLLFSIYSQAWSQSHIFKVEKGLVNFQSEARHELISARSTDVRGIVDPVNKTFAFKVPIISFASFNSPLQREHFNENYMETSDFPEATFKGKIIEDVDVSVDGSYQIRAKGKLNIHGIDQERIIRVQLKVNGQTMRAESQFTVSLSDHNIRIPRIVTDKLAPVINVVMNATLTAKN